MDNSNTNLDAPIEAIASRSVGMADVLSDALAQLREDLRALPKQMSAEDADSLERALAFIARRSSAVIVDGGDQEVHDRDLLSAGNTVKLLGVKYGFEAASAIRRFALGVTDRIIAGLVTALVAA